MGSCTGWHITHVETGATHWNTRTHGAEKSQLIHKGRSASSAATAVLVSSAPAASCCRCTPAYYYADIIRCCTTTPSPPSPSPTSAAVCWISFLGRSCARWLVVQSSQGARGEEFAAELRSFPASRRLLWGVRSLALPRRSSRAFVRAAVRLIQPGLLRQHPCAPHRGRIPCLPRRMSKQ